MTQRVAIALAVAGAATFTVAGCGAAPQGPDQAGSVQDVAKTKVDTGNLPSMTHLTRSSQPPVPPGPNSALFDPCTVVNWQSITAGSPLRLAGDERPPRVVEDFGPNWTAACVFDDSIVTIPNPLDEYPDDSNDKGRAYYWRANILWGTSCGDCTPNGMLGRDGSEKRVDRSDETAPFPSEQCNVTTKVGDGYAAVALFNNKFPDDDTCGRARAILNTVLDRVE